ncbi:MAG: hypothetical protein HRU24_08285 [Gammaproteobacteria bacterium]|nr:hypothetical protein [Gammaproteobacteria bacterium]
MANYERVFYAGSCSREHADSYIDYSASLSKGYFTFTVMDVNKNSIDSDVRVVVSYNYSFDL